MNLDEGSEGSERAVYRALVLASTVTEHFTKALFIRLKYELHWHDFGHEVEHSLCVAALFLWYRYWYYPRASSIQQYMYINILGANVMTVDANMTVSQSRGSSSLLSV